MIRIENSNTVQWKVVIRYGICVANETISSTDDKSISLAIKKAKEKGINKVVLSHPNHRTGSEKGIIEDTSLLPDNNTAFGVYGLDCAPARVENCAICNIVCAGAKSAPLSIEGLEGEFEINGKRL